MSPRREQNLGREPASLGRCTVVACTEKGLKVDPFEPPGAEPYWVPRSVVHEDSDLPGDAVEEDDGELFVFQWWADKEGR